MIDTSARSSRCECDLRQSRPYVIGAILKPCPAFLRCMHTSQGSTLCQSLRHWMASWPNEPGDNSSPAQLMRQLELQPQLQQQQGLLPQLW